MSLLLAPCDEDEKQTKERELFKAALAARSAGLAEQGLARCKGKEVDFFAVFGCSGLPVPRKRDARRALLAFSLGVR